MHVVVLHHGLWGMHSNMQSIADALTKSHPELTIVNITVNSRLATQDGCDYAGERASRYLEEHFLPNADRITFIGYSMGGVFTRYIVGRLYAHGWLDKVKPMNFITFASPHLGTVRPERATSFLTRFFHTVGVYAIQRSGAQILLEDSFVDNRPLLDVMADPAGPFWQGLQQFQRLALYADVQDRVVPYPSAAIMNCNPFLKPGIVALRSDPRHPSFVVPTFADDDVAPDDVPALSSTTGKATVLDTAEQLAPGLQQGSALSTESSDAHDAGQEKVSADKSTTGQSDGSVAPQTRPLRQLVVPEDYSSWRLLKLWALLPVWGLFLLVHTIRGWAYIAWRRPHLLFQSSWLQTLMHPDDAVQDDIGAQADATQQLASKKSIADALHDAATDSLGDEKPPVANKGSKSESVPHSDKQAEGKEAESADYGWMTRHATLMDQMIANLNKLPWVKHAVLTVEDGAHNAIIVKHPAQHAEFMDILDHLAENFAS